MVALAPITQSQRRSTITALKPGFLRSIRAPKRTSCQRFGMNRLPRASCEGTLCASGLDVAGALVLVPTAHFLSKLAEKR